MQATHDVASKESPLLGSRGFDHKAVFLETGEVIAQQLEISRSTITASPEVA